MIWYIAFVFESLLFLSVSLIFLTVNVLPFPYEIIRYISALTNFVLLNRTLDTIFFIITVVLIVYTIFNVKLGNKNKENQPTEILVNIFLVISIINALVLFIFTGEMKIG